MNEKAYELSPTNTTFSEKDYEDINIKKDNDEEIAKKIDVRIDEAKPLHDSICKNAEDSLSIFRGKVDELAGSKTSKYKSKAVLSRIFLTIRNLVGLTTDNPAFVEIIPDNDNPKSIRRAKSIEANVEWRMIDSNFYEKLAKALFDAWIKRDAFFHWHWNEDIEDIDVDVVAIEDLTISPDATDIKDAEFVIYHPLKNRKWWKKNHADIYDDIKFEKKSKNEEISSDRGNVARLIQYWENDFMVEKVKGKDGDIIMSKKKNPYYEYRTLEEQLLETAKGINPDIEASFAEAGIGNPTPEDIVSLVPEMQEFVPVKNYLIEPRKPFVQLPSIKLIGEMYSEEVTQQVREVFLAMNDKKRAYADNLRGCNQKIIVDSGSYTKEEANKITDEPNQVLRADFQINPKPVYIEKGGEVPRSFHEDIRHDEDYIDDVYGHHEISRGSGKAKTLGQDQMNYESDRTPVRLQTRATERAIVEIMEGWLQLMTMFYTEKHYAKKFGEKEGLQLIEIINEDIEEGVKPHIKPGSMISISKADKANRAMSLYQNNALDPLTLFQEMEMNDPAKLADRLVNWLSAGAISDEDPESLMADKMATDPILQSVERANQENEAIQEGDDKIPPTPPEFITEEHVKMHYAFLGDKDKKLEDDDRDMLIAHADVDKATLTKLLAEEGAAQGQKTLDNNTDK